MHSVKARRQVVLIMSRAAFHTFLFFLCWQEAYVVLANSTRFVSRAMLVFKAYKYIYSLPHRIYHVAFPSLFQSCLFLFLGRSSLSINTVNERSSPYRRFFVLVIRYRELKFNYYTTTQ